MSATTVLNNVAIAPNSSISGVFAATQPYRGVQVQMIQTMAKVATFGVNVSYQVSIDGGTT